MQVLAGAMRVRSLVAAAVAKADEQRTNLFLSAASHGDSDTILQVRAAIRAPAAADSRHCCARSAAVVLTRWTPTADG
jgi:hypothetical protein